MNADSNKNLTKWDIYETFVNHNIAHGYRYGDHQPDELYAVIVYAQSNFKQPYTELERSYAVSSKAGKMFFPDMMSNSVYGDCLDGIDTGVRLDCYNWVVERCYFTETDPTKPTA